MSALISPDMLSSVVFCSAALRCFFCHILASLMLTWSRAGSGWKPRRLPMSPFRIVRILRRCPDADELWHCFSLDVLDEGVELVVDGVEPHLNLAVVLPGMTGTRHTLVKMALNNSSYFTSSPDWRSRRGAQKPASIHHTPSAEKVTSISYSHSVSKIQYDTTFLTLTVS